MGIIYFLILIAVILILLSFIIALKVELEVDSKKPDVSIYMHWLEPFIKVYVTRIGKEMVLDLYLFNKNILNKNITKGKNKHGGMELVQISNPKDVHVDIHYGFKDPFATGIACGAVNIASQFVNVDSIMQTPDFMSDDDYIYLDATAKVNIGSTLVKLFKSRINSGNKKEV